MTEGLYLDEAIEETGIEERNIKYWCQKYDIPVKKDGRKNVYPPRILKILKMINIFSETELFNHHFIRIQVQRALGKKPGKIEGIARYNRAREEGRKILSEIKGATGTEILPSVKGGTVRRSKRSPSKISRPKNTTELNEDLL